MIKTVAIAVITRLLVYATTCIALPVFRWRQSAPKAEFTAPFGIAAAVISLVLIVWLLMQVKFEELRYARAGDCGDRTRNISCR